MVLELVWRTCLRDRCGVFVLTCVSTGVWVASGGYLGTDSEPKVEIAESIVAEALIGRRLCVTKPD